MAMRNPHSGFHSFPLFAWTAKEDVVQPTNRRHQEWAIRRQRAAAPMKMKTPPSVSSPEPICRLRAHCLREMMRPQEEDPVTLWQM